MGYINTLWNQRDTYRDFTKQYFGTEGLNVPGVCTLTGQPMGGWIQYSMSPTCGAWLAHHFYLQWVYSADKDFLADKAYPFVRDVATYLEQLSFIDDDGKRKLPASSSPEVNDNSISAWFKSLTNYDNALMTSLFGHAAEMADSLGLHEESAHWHTLKASMPQLDTDEENVLTIAKGHPYRQSHRHFSHAMAIFPLGILDVAQGAEDAEIVKSTIKRLTDVGPDWWCGYSYSWLGNLQARALNGDGAADALRIFAECFCLPNTFHVNGDQTNTGKSKFTYRPFTLEGNFAFAAGVQEMLLQSHRNMIEVFPAIPSNWRDVSFTDLRGRGAFLVSATMVDGAVSQISIKSEKGGTLRLRLPDKDMIVDCVSKHSITPNVSLQLRLHRVRQYHCDAGNRQRAYKSLERTWKMRHRIDCRWRKQHGSVEIATHGCGHHPHSGSQIKLYTRIYITGGCGDHIHSCPPGIVRPDNMGQCCGHFLRLRHRIDAEAVDDGVVGYDEITPIGATAISGKSRQGMKRGHSVLHPVEGGKIGHPVAVGLHHHASLRPDDIGGPALHLLTLHP